MSPQAELQELFELEALGGLGPADSLRLSALLSDYPELAGERANAQALALSLAHEVAEIAPPTRVRESLMQRLENSHNDTIDASIGARNHELTARREDMHRKQSRVSSTRVALVAAAALIVLLPLAAWIGGLIRSNNDLENRISKLETELIEQRRLVALLEDRTTRLHNMMGTPEAPEAYGRVLYAPRTNGAVIVLTNLPAIPADHTFQIWVLTPEGPVSAGFVTGIANQRATGEVLVKMNEATVNGFALSIEPAGGVPAPTGPIVLVSDG